MFGCEQSGSIRSQTMPSGQAIAFGPAQASGPLGGGGIVVEDVELVEEVELLVDDVVGSGMLVEVVMGGGMLVEVGVAGSSGPQTSGGSTHENPAFASTAHAKGSELTITMPAALRSEVR